MDQKIILFQGDSITDCGRNREQPASMGTGYGFLVKAALGSAEPYAYNFYNMGISGNRVVDVYARIKKDIINLKPDYMSILIGINDVWHEYTRKNGVEAPKFEKIYDMLITEIREALPNIKIMILEPFVLPGSATMNTEEHPSRWDFFCAETALRRVAAKRVADKHNLMFVPLQEIFDKANADAPAMGYWLSDGVHPTPCGHELIKNAWLEAFKEMA